MSALWIEKDGYIVKAGIKLSEAAEYFGLKQPAFSMHIKRNKQPECNWMAYNGYIVHWRKVNLPMFDNMQPAKLESVRKGHTKGAPLLVGHVTHQIH
jgi:hypothetical protein